jgi:L-cystine transport system substrate-binding protein
MFNIEYHKTGSSAKDYDAADCRAIRKETIMKKVQGTKISTAIGVLGVSFLLISLALLGGCEKKDSGAAPAAQVREVVIGTGNAMKDFCFLDEKGSLVGLEIDVLNELFKLLPQYRFTIETSDFAGILVGLETGRFDVAVHHYAKNESRVEKYLFAKEPIVNEAGQLAVKPGRTDIQGIEDLGGKTIPMSRGNAIIPRLEAYNEAHPDSPINIVYGSLDTETQIKGLEEGRFDALWSNERSIVNMRKNFNNRVEAAGPPTLPSYTYYIYRKGDETLQADVDAAIRILRENGTLKEISKKWLGADYTYLLPELEEARLSGKDYLDS